MAASLSLFAVIPAVASDSLSTKDGLTIRLAPPGRIEAVAVSGRKISGAPLLPFSVREFLPPDGKRTDWGMIPARATADDDRIRVEGQHESAALVLKADLATPQNGAFIEVNGDIRDLTGRDRALRLTFAIPLDLSGWLWENTAFRAERIAGDNRYPNHPADVHYLDRVGARKGRDAMLSGFPVNKLPYTVVVSNDVGLALACPTHEPRVFLARADAKGLTITFTLGLSPETKHHPCSAGFRCILYRIDPAWGIRSAAERYRQFFPELFASRNRRHGNYTVLRSFSPERPNPWPENAGDFGFLFAENDFQRTNGEMRPRAAEEAKRLGLIVFHWRGPWYYFHAVEKGTPRPTQLALLKAQAEGRAPGAHGKNNQLCGCPDRISAQGAFNSHLINERGQLDRGHHPRNYGSYLMGMNMNPDLPKPNRASLAFDWQYRFIKRWDEPDFRGPRNFAWDALDDWGGFRRLNFRREHFAYEQPPLVFETETGRLCILNGFTHWAFARKHATMVRKKGGLIMCNANLEQALLFCAPYIDVQVKERPAKRWDDERLTVERMLAGPKPISFIGGWQPPSGAALEATIRKLLLYGIAPGSTAKDEQRGLMKKYMPVLQRIARAGWEPVTHARAEGLLIERFGKAPGPVYFAVANRGERAVDGKLRIDLAALGIAEHDTLDVTEHVERRELTPQKGNNRLEMSLRVKEGETLVLGVKAGADN